MTAPAQPERWRRLGALGAVGLVVASGWHVLTSAGCGGGAECGNGVEEDGEECDDGNSDELDSCRVCMAYIPPRTTVKWEFNKDPSRGFDGDSCGDLRVSKVRVEMSGPASASQEPSCGNREAVFPDLPPGAYTATVTPLNSAGASLVTAPVTAPIEVQAINTLHEVVIPWDRWSATLTGSFYFRLLWGGQPCATASPVVARQVLTLLVRGLPVTQVTDTGQRVDGADPQPCRPSTDQFPQVINDLPFGPATLTVRGLTAGGVEQYRGQFDTFVGATTNNPEARFDVPGPDAAMPPDAAVDAAVDASVDAP